VNRPQLEQLIRDSLTQSPETHAHMLAARIRELEAQVAHAIPADRVLGEGMVAMDGKMIESAALFLEEYASRIPGISAVIAALRANQGGAAT